MTNTFCFSEFELDLAQRELRRNGVAVEMQPKVFAVLALLVQNPGRALDREDFLEQVWSGRFVTENVLSRCIRELRKALNDDAASPSYIRTVRGHGYQFVAPVECLSAGDGTDTRRLAVLPFRPLVPESAQPALELGLADTLVNDLSRIEGLVVRPLSVVLDAAEGGRLEDPIALGRRLKVDVVIEGWMQVVDKRVRLNTRALRVQDGSALMAERFEEALTDLFSVQDRLSQGIMGMLAIRFGGDGRTAEVLRGTHSVEAYRAYVAGRLDLAENSVESIESALAHFERALQHDADYLEPLIGIAEANDLMATLGTDPAHFHDITRRAAEKVIALDPSRARAYTCLGKVTWQHDWDWKRAESLLCRATELDPGDAEALIALSDFLCYQARFEEALEVAERAGELNPFSPWIQSLIVQALYMGGWSEEAVAQARRAVELAPEYGFARFFHGLALNRLGRMVEGIGEIQKAIELTGRQDFAGALGYALGRAGQRDAARGMLDEMRQAADQGMPVPPIAFATIHAGLGEIGTTLEYLGQVVKQRSWHILLLHSDYAFEEVRARPEGLALLREAGLPA